MTIRARQVLLESDRVFIQARETAWLAELIGSFVPLDRVRPYLPNANKWGFARHDRIYETIADEIADLVKADRQVSVAALGDASFYSYFTYLEAPLAQRGVAWEYVPGVPFLTAASLTTGRAFVEALDTLVVKRIAHVSELDDIFRIASVVVLYGVARDQLAQIREYAIAHGIEYARTAWLGTGADDSYGVDILVEESQWRLGCSVILRRRCPS